MTFHYTGTGGTGVYGVSVENTPYDFVPGTKVIASIPSAVIRAAFNGNKMYVSSLYSGTIKMKMTVYRNYKVSNTGPTGEFSALVEGTCSEDSYLNEDVDCYTLDVSIPDTLTFGIYLFT